MSRGRRGPGTQRLSAGGARTLAIALLLALSCVGSQAFAQDQVGGGATAPATAAPNLGATPPPAATPPGALPGAGSFLPGTPDFTQAMPTAVPPGIATPAPPVGVSVRLGDVGGAIAAASALAATGGPPAGLTIIPSLGVTEEFNSNIFDTAADRQADFITSLNPGILVNLATPMANGTLSYFPSFQFYARNSSQNNIVQNLDGSLNATLLPRTLFLALNAYSSQQTTAGGVVPGGVNIAPSGNRVTTTAFSVRPTFEHIFPDIGTLQIGYGLLYSNQSGNTATVAGASLPFFVPSETVANEGNISFTTGPELGRFNDTVTGVATIATGTGVLAGAHQYFATNTLRYAVARRVYIFGTVGYENIFYASVPVVRISDAIWAGGINLTPGPSTSITAGYGHIEGLDAPFVQATIALSARTSLAVSYSNTLGTSLQFLQSALNNVLVDAAGNPISSVTGAPVLLANELLGVQSSLFRNALFSTSLVTTFPRDTITFSVFNEQQKLIANAPGVAGFSQNSWSGSVNWTHSLTPVLTAGVYAQLGESNAQSIGGGSNTIAGGQLSLVYQLTPTLAATALYGITNSSVIGGNALQNIVVLGLQKTF